MIVDIISTTNLYIFIGHVTWSKKKFYSYGDMRHFRNSNILDFFLPVITVDYTI